MKFDWKLTILVCVVIVSFFGYGAYDAHLKKQPTTIYMSEDVIRETVEDMIGKDSTISVPITYEYTEETFEQSGTTYWFFYSSATGKDAKTNKTLDFGNQTRVVKMPYNFFNFEYAAKFLSDNLLSSKTAKDNNVKKVTIFITNFKQISEASYKSYSVYAKKY